MTYPHIPHLPCAVTHGNKEDGCSTCLMAITYPVITNWEHKVPPLLFGTNRGYYRVLRDLYHYLITTVHDLPTPSGVAHFLFFNVIGNSVSVDIKAKQSWKVHVHTQWQIVCDRQNVRKLVALMDNVPQQRCLLTGKQIVLSHVPGWEQTCGQIPDPNDLLRKPVLGVGGEVWHVGWAAGLTREVFFADKETEAIDWCRRCGDSGRYH